MIKVVILVIIFTIYNIWINYSLFVQISISQIYLDKLKKENNNLTILIKNNKLINSNLNKKIKNNYDLINKIIFYEINDFNFTTDILSKNDYIKKINYIIYQKEEILNNLENEIINNNKINHNLISEINYNEEILFFLKKRINKILNKN